MPCFRRFLHSGAQMYIPSIFVAYKSNVIQPNGRWLAYKMLDGHKKLKF